MERLNRSEPPAGPATTAWSPSVISPAAVNELLERWMTEDADEHRESFELLRRALDEHRPPECKLFP